MRQSEKYWMKVLVLALCLCLSYATYTFHIVSRSGFRVLPHLYWWTTAFQLFFFAALPKFCLSCFKKQNTQWSGIKNVLFVLAEYLSINCSKFNPRKIIFPLQQNIFSTPDGLSYFTNWIVLTNFRRRQTHDKHKNNIVTNGWLLFLGNLLPRFLSYSASRGWVG